MTESKTAPAVASDNSTLDDQGQEVAKPRAVGRAIMQWMKGRARPRIRMNVVNVVNFGCNYIGRIPSNMDERHVTAAQGTCTHVILSMLKGKEPWEDGGALGCDVEILSEAEAAEDDPLPGPDGPFRGAESYCSSLFLRQSQPKKKK